MENIFHLACMCARLYVKCLCLCGYYKYDVIVAEQLNADQAVCRYWSEGSVHTRMHTQISASAVEGNVAIPNLDYSNVKAEVIMSAVTNISVGLTVTTM